MLGVGIRGRAPRATAACLVLVTVSFGALLARTAKAGSGSTRVSPSSITIDLRATRQQIDGFGTSAYPWEHPHLSQSATTSVPAAAQRKILQLVFEKLGLTRVRVVLGRNVQPTSNSPLRFDGRYGDWQIALVKQERQYGLKTFFPDPVYLEDWMTPNDPQDAAQWALQMLLHWRAAGVEPPYYSVLNEPQVAGNFPPEWMDQVVRQLGGAMRAAGLKTKLVIPDDENPDDAYRRALAVLQDPQARQYVGALAYHIYHGFDDGSLIRMRELARRYGLHLWMTEYESPDYTDWSHSLDWAQRMHTLLTTGGVNAIDYLWAFYGSWTRPATMVSIDFDNGVYRSFELTPVYWITGQYSRFVRPGYRRVQSSPEQGSVETTAFTGAGRVVVVCVNPSGSPQAVRLLIHGGRIARTASAVRSSPTEHWRTLPIVPVRNGAFAVTLQAESVTTFIVRRS